MEDLIKELLSARKKKGITQLDLANKVGFPQSHISSIEHGKIDIRISTLVQMSRVLDYEIMLIPRQLKYLVEAIIEGKEDIDVEPLWQPDEGED